jgi:hypothetical protein
MDADLIWYLIAVLNAGLFFGRLTGGYLAATVGSFDFLELSCAVYGSRGAVLASRNLNRSVDRPRAAVRFRLWQHHRADAHGPC